MGWIFIKCLVFEVFAQVTRVAGLDPYAFGVELAERDAPLAGEETAGN